MDAANENLTPVVRPYLSATTRFATGAQTPRAYLEDCLAAYAAWEPRIGAFVCTNLPGARAAADQATERWRHGRPLPSRPGPLRGLDGDDLVRAASERRHCWSPNCKTKPFFTVGHEHQLTNVGVRSVD
jgi:hypothetical protein